MNEDTITGICTFTLFIIVMLILILCRMEAMKGGLYA